MAVKILWLAGFGYFFVSGGGRFLARIERFVSGAEGGVGLD